MTFPQKFFVLGHDNNSRQTRKANPRFGRLVRFGNDFVVRPKRRVEISFDLLAKHADAVLEAISSGAITLAHSSDSYVDPAEFRELVRAYMGTRMPPVLEPGPVPAPGTVIEAPKVPETATEASETVAGLPEVVTEPETAAEEAGPQETVLETTSKEPEKELGPETDSRRNKKGRR